MLVLTRRSREIVRIQLAEGVDPEIPARQLFADGPIELVVTQVQSGQVKLGISADRRFLILRDELCRKEKGEDFSAAVPDTALPPPSVESSLRSK
jgi:sRNA-binding carbon storage regulator CsrA